MLHLPYRENMCVSNYHTVADIIQVHIILYFMVSCVSITCSVKLLRWTRLHLRLSPLCWHCHLQCLEYKCNQEVVDEVKGRRISQFCISLILEIPAGPSFHLAVLRMSFSDLILFLFRIWVGNHKQMIYHSSKRGDSSVEPQ